MLKKSFNPRQILNDVVRPVLVNKVTDLYALNNEGQHLVLESNRNLTEKYVETHRYSIDKYWYGLIKKNLLIYPPKNFNTIVDICCGSGFITTNIMNNQLFNNCYSIDINLHQLVELKNILTSKKIDAVHVIRGDVLKLPFKDGSVDAVIGNSFLHHIPDNPKLLNEIHRILKPGGVFCCTHEPSINSIYIEQFPVGYTIRLFDLMHIKNLVRRILGRPFKPKTQGQPVLSDIWIYSEKNAKLLLEQAGFNEISVTSKGLTSTIIIKMIRTFIVLSGKRNSGEKFITSMQRIFDFIDRIFFKTWLPKDCFSSMQFNARKTSRSQL
jgi:demethylmenaquinone methyltransferase / 2-methoxy-6-polyprenyl-1,4-benzoquinol methylase